MNATKVAESRDTIEAFPRFELQTSKEEISSERKDAARALALLLHKSSLELEKKGVDEKGKAEFERIVTSIKNESAKLGDSELNYRIQKFLRDVSEGKNPFRDADIGLMEFQLLIKYGHSTLTVPDFGFSGLAEVTEKRQLERSGHTLTVLNIDVTGERPPSCFYLIKRGARERMIAEVISSTYENKKTIEQLFHLQDVARGIAEPKPDVIFGHNAFLGMYSSIIRKENYGKLDAGFVREWMRELLADDVIYKEERVLRFSEEAERMMGGNDPNLWARVQMLRHIKKGMDELSATGLSREKLRAKLPVTFNTIREDHELQHALNHLNPRKMPVWMDELSGYASSTHGYSREYPGGPQFSFSITLPVFSVVMDTLSGGKTRERILSLDLYNASPQIMSQVEDDERAAFHFVHWMVKLNKGETLELNKLGRGISWDATLDPIDVLSLGRLDSYILRQRALLIQESIQKSIKP